MAFVVEDGTGLANANAMATVEAIDNYWADRGNAAWAALTTTQKQQRIVEASSALSDEKTYPYNGQKVSYAQRMPWPRNNAFENNGGPVVPNNVVPWRLVDAVAIMADAARAGIELQPTIEPSERVKSETVGPISVTYFDPGTGGGLVPVFTGVLAILSPLLRCADSSGLSYGQLTHRPGWSGRYGQHPPIFDVGMQDAPGTGQPGGPGREDY